MHQVSIYGKIDYQRLTGILEILESTINPHGKDQFAIMEKYREFEKDDSFMQYLLFIMSEMKLDGPDSETRTTCLQSAAGLTLKSFVKANLQRFSHEMKEILISSCLNMFSSATAPLKKISGLIISEVAYKDFSSRESIVQNLICIVMSSNSPTCVELAIKDIYNISYDLTSLEASSKEECDIFACFIMPHMTKILSHENPVVRSYALSTIALFLFVSLGVVLDAKHCFLNNIIQLTTDPSNEMKESLCMCIIRIVEISISYLPDIPRIIQYILDCSSSESYNVKKIAAEFWVLITQNRNMLPMVSQFSHLLIPILMQNMVYSDQDFETLCIYDDDSERTFEDNDLNIPQPERARKIEVTDCEIQNDSFDDDEDEYNQRYLDEYAQTNSPSTLRQHSACSLDFLSLSLKQNILPYVLPIVQRCLQSNDWLFRESGIFSLGAIAYGCIDAMYEHLPVLVPYFFDSLKDTKALVRSIACWTLSRYAAFFENSENQVLYRTLICEIIFCCGDQSSHVQSYAFSALSLIIESGHLRIMPYCQEILKFLFQMCPKYRKLSLCSFFETVATLCESNPQICQCSAFQELVIPGIVGQFVNHRRNDDTFITLMNCTGRVMKCGPDLVKEYLPSVLQVCSSVIKQTSCQEMASKIDPHLISSPNLNYLYGALDLASLLLQIFKESSSPSVVESELPLAVMESFEIEECCVKEFSFQLLADLARYSFVNICNILPEALQHAKKAMDCKNVNISSDALLFICETVRSSGPGFSSYLGDFIEKTFNLVNSSETVSPRTVRTLAVLLLCRLGNIFTTEFSCLDNYFHSWSEITYLMYDSSEKEECFEFVCKLIRLNPGLHIAKFPSIIKSFSSWSSPTERVRSLLLEFLTICHQIVTPNDQINSLFSMITPEAAEIFKQRFDLTTHA